MLRSISGKFIAAVLATSIAVTSFSAAPARADSDDAAKIAFGLATLFILGKALSDDDKNTVHRHRHYKPHPKPHKPYKTRNRHHLPAKCHFVHNTRSGKVAMVNRKCLIRHYNYNASLPQVCRTQANTPKGFRSGYNPRCLRNKGYRIVRF